MVILMSHFQNITSVAFFSNYNNNNNNNNAVQHNPPATLALSDNEPSPLAKQQLESETVPAENPRKCSSHSQQSSRCDGQRPHQHVYYLKTHKTGSSTMYSILAEYSRMHDLLPLVPSSGAHINQAPPVRDGQLLLPPGKPGTQKFDMVFNHHVYSPPIFKHLHNDTVKITTVREPFRQFISSFTYFRWEGMEYLQRIPGNDPDPVMTFLKDRRKYEARGYTSYTNNRQSIDLGYDIRHSFDDTQYTSEFIKQTEQRFDLILITEYFHESLVIMKRRLHWSTQDILHFAKLTQKKKDDPKSIEERQSRELAYKKIHATFSQADMALYSHFLGLFKQRMRSEEGLQEEVGEFKDTLEKVRVYCDSHQSQTSGSTLHIPAGRWSDPVYILPYKCKWLKMPELEFTRYLQKRQKAVLSHDYNTVKLV